MLLAGEAEGLGGGVAEVVALGVLAHGVEVAEGFVFGVPGDLGGGVGLDDGGAEVVGEGIGAAAGGWIWATGRSPNQTISCFMSFWAALLQRFGESSFVSARSLSSGE